MKTPSIEAPLSRTTRDSLPTLVRRLHELPVVGTYVRAWIRATRSDEPRSLWVSLPPVVA